MCRDRGHDRHHRRYAQHHAEHQQQLLLRFRRVRLEHGHAPSLPPPPRAPSRGWPRRAGGVSYPGTGPGWRTRRRRRGSDLVLHVAFAAGQDAGGHLGEHEGGHEGDGQVPAAGALVEGADEDGAGDGQQVAGALGEGGELGDPGTGAGAHADHGQRQREGAVGDAHQQGPGDRGGGGREPEPGVAGEAEGAERGNQPALVAHPGGERGQDEGERDAEHHGDRQQHARGGGRHARVPEDLRQPPHGDVRAGGLEAEEDGERPGGPAAGDPDARRGAGGRGAGGGTPAGTGHREPRHHGDHGERRPDPQAQPPAAAHRPGQRHRTGRGDRGAQGERHRVQPRHGADPVGEVPLDDHRQEHVADGYAGQPQRAGGEEDRGALGERAQQQPAGDGGHAGADHRAGAEPAGQPGRGGAEDGEAHGGYGGEQPGHRAVHVQPGAHLGHERPEAGDRRTQVDRGDHQRDGDQPPGEGGQGCPGGGSGAGGRRSRGGRHGTMGCVGGVGGRHGSGYGGSPVVFGQHGLVVSHGAHHRIMG
ncbi:putative Glycine-rich cell wall structural protein 1.8 [Streptantibioticus cattleyicolor NRRL 8057 = DSM 46488]|nr:putative Glycine-rich cell wall structural protein 1.8 [Streptantibioticus cattleyicolor NRRL 8057 = DSM 46488]